MSNRSELERTKTSLGNVWNRLVERSGNEPECDSVDSLLLRAWSASKISESIQGIENVLKMDPTNELAKAGLAWFGGLQSLGGESDGQVHSEEESQGSASPAATEDVGLKRLLRQIEAEQVCDFRASPVDDSSVSIERWIQAELRDMAEEIRQMTHNPEGIPQQDQANSSKLILVADDDTLVRLSADAILGDHGYRVILAVDGYEALQVLEECQPDLILADVNMPRMDGYRLCRVVRNAGASESVPVLLMSGQDGAYDPLRGKTLGCSGHICKPLETESLLTAVAEHVGVEAAMMAR